MNFTNSSKNSNVDAFGLNAGALHALWTLEGLGAITAKEGLKVAVGALDHPAAAVRKAAIQVLPSSEATDTALLQAQVLSDVNKSVQLEALLYFSKRPASETMGRHLFALSKLPEITNDIWLSKAVYIAASQHRVGFTNSFLKENPQSDLEEVPLYERQEIAYDDSKWENMALPQKIEDAGVDIDGVIWFRKKIALTAIEAATSASISLGPINDSDIVYINGKLVGTTKNSWEEPRMYKIGPSVLKTGENVIGIWVEDTGGGGGLWGEKEELFLLLGNQKRTLVGDWKYDVEKDYSGRSNAFAKRSIAEVLYESYKGKPLPIAGTEMTDKNATVINIKTIKNEMKFDVTEFTVEAGATIEVVFDNNDFMQHNILILAQGSTEKVGVAADKLAQDPTGAEKSYIPNMPEVLHASAMVNPEQKVVLRFIAPTEPGEYPFICTFPGHWRIMQGVMKVVANPI